MWTAPHNRAKMFKRIIGPANKINVPALRGGAGDGFTTIRPALVRGARAIGLGATLLARVSLPLAVAGGTTIGCPSTRSNSV